MTTTDASALPVTEQSLEQKAQLLDQALHALWSQGSMGLSPISLTLAFLDWALHVGTSPGQQMLWLQQALSAIPQGLAWQAQDKDPRFRHEAARP